MEFANTNLIPMDNNFNWDDIEVGNHALDHSQNFFTKKHIEHERLIESEGDLDLLKEIDAITLDCTLSANDDKENLNIISTPKTIKSELKELQNLILNEDNKFESQIAMKFEKSDKSPVRKIEQKILSESLIARNRARINPGGNRKKSPTKSPSKNLCPLVPNPIVLSESLIMRNKARINPGKKTEKVTTTIANAVSDTQTVSTAKHALSPLAPHAYQCNELYKRRKEELIRKRSEEERKMRVFHSRPVPNFSACHKSLQQRKIVHAVTVPVTPVVLKKSLAADEKRKKKLEELKVLHPPKFEPRPTTVIHEEPFVPKKTQTVLVPCPFNLRSDRRLQERKLYDASVQRAMDEKQKQEEKERKKREELRIKELRKLTTFKARPNPFK